MKKFIVVLGMSFLIILCGFGVGYSKTIDASRLIKRNGLAYEIFHQKPYTGKFVKLDRNGKKSLEENYRDGKLNGKTITWDGNGQKVGERTWKDNKLNGKLIYWYENGQKSVEGTYKNDKKNGKWLDWNEAGKKVKEETYKDGELIK